MHCQLICNFTHMVTNLEGTIALYTGSKIECLSWVLEQGKRASTLIKPL